MNFYTVLRIKKTSKLVIKQSFQKVKLAPFGPLGFLNWQTSKKALKIEAIEAVSEDFQKTKQFLTPSTKHKSEKSLRSGKEKHISDITFTHIYPQVPFASSLKTARILIGFDGSTLSNSPSKRCRMSVECRPLAYQWSGAALVSTTVP